MFQGFNNVAEAYYSADLLWLSLHLWLGVVVKTDGRVAILPPLKAEILSQY